MHTQTFPTLFTRIVAVIALLLAMGLPATAATDTIRSTLAIQDRQIEIDILFPASLADTVSLSASTWAGVEDYHEDIRDLRAASTTGSSLQVDSLSPGQWLVHTNQEAFRLSYTVFNRRESFMGNSRTDHFHAALFDSYMFAWGDACLLEIGDSVLNELPVQVTILSPQYGPVYTNRDLSKPVANLPTLSESLFAAGDYNHVTDTILQTRVDYLVQRADWVFTPQEYFDAVRRILETQAKAFGFYPTDRMLIVLNEGLPSSMGGTVIEDAIALSADPALPLDQGGIRTLKLIAHENVHVWNGNHMHPEESRSEGYHKWFQEGVTDYYAWLTLYRTGVLSDWGFTEAMNSLIVDYSRNPYATTATADTLAEKNWSSEDYRSLPYNKGAVIGLLIDLSLRRQYDGALGLDSMMRELMADSAVLAGGYDENSIRRHLEDISHTDWQPFFEQCVIGASPLPLDSMLTAVGVECGVDTIAVFDLGLALGPVPDSKRKQIVSVVSGSAAEKAGLREGDLLTGWSYDRNQVELPVELKVVRDSVEIEFSYVASRSVPILQIQTSPSSRAALRTLLLR